MATPKKKSPQLPAKRIDKQKQSAVRIVLYNFNPDGKMRLAVRALREILAIFGYEVEA